MDILRTPDECFAALPDFPYEPKYVEVAADGAADGAPDGAADGAPDGVTLRLAYIAEGPADGDVVLRLHGEPSWSFLYRHMIPVFVDAGLRVVCPDLVGFGRSDKPADRNDYTYAAHVEWLRAALFDHLDLSAITLVCQDWGGLLGLRLVGEHPDRFARVVAANTFLPTGDSDLGKAFRAWCDFSQSVETFPTGFIVNSGCTTDLSEGIVAAYDAPYPDETFKEGARQFPTLVPASPEDPAAPANRAAWTVLETFDRPFLCAFGDSDPITGGADAVLKGRIPGTKGQPHTTIVGGGHFIQEDRGPELATVVVDFIRTT